MVNTTIDNAVVSIQLSSGQSTTVPSNENWKVTLVIGMSDPTGSGFGRFNASETNLTINGIELKYSVNQSTGKEDSFSNNGGTAAAVVSGGPELALTGGDTISISGDACFIQGFVVSS